MAELKRLRSGDFEIHNYIEDDYKTPNPWIEVFVLLPNMDTPGLIIKIKTAEAARAVQTPQPPPKTAG